MSDKPVDALTEAEARIELARLAMDIGYHDVRYHQDDAPEISDADYDALRHRNADIEARFPSCAARTARAFGLARRHRAVLPKSVTRGPCCRSAMHLMRMTSTISLRGPVASSVLEKMRRWLWWRSLRSTAYPPRCDMRPADLRSEQRVAMVRRAKILRVICGRSTIFPKPLLMRPRSLKCAARSICHVMTSSL